MFGCQTVLLERSVKECCCCLVVVVVVVVVVVYAFRCQLLHFEKTVRVFLFGLLCSFTLIFTLKSIALWDVKLVNPERTIKGRYGRGGQTRF